MTTILFVCIENSNRSQMVEAFAKIHGSNIISAYSAGSKPSGIINSKAICAMKQKGYDLTTHTSKSVDKFKNQAFDYVITMGCGDECPYVVAKNRIDWNIPDPKNMNDNDFNKVRDLIETKILNFIHTLENTSNI